MSTVWNPKPPWVTSSMQQVCSAVLKNCWEGQFKTVVRLQYFPTYQRCQNAEVTPIKPKSNTFCDNPQTDSDRSDED
jgi:hypothetical protein